MPYSRLPKDKWAAKTKKLVAAHPLNMKELVEVVLLAWDAIFESQIGPHGFKIDSFRFCALQSEHTPDSSQTQSLLAHSLAQLR